MDNDIVVALVLSVIVMALSFWKNQFLMGAYSVLLIVGAEVIYRIYLKYEKKNNG
jgi:hypothetical protein